MHTVPGNLLPRHRHLLNQDFHDLGNNTTLQCQLWVASMTSAIKAAHTVLIGNYKRGSLEIFFQPKHSSANRHPSTSHHSQWSNNRARYTPPHRPRQQKLPSTLWTPLPITALPQTPPVSHPTDLAGTWYNSTGNGNRKEHIWVWSDLFASTRRIGVPLWSLHRPGAIVLPPGGKERRNIVCPYICIPLKK